LEPGQGDGTALDGLMGMSHGGHAIQWFDELETLSGVLKSPVLDVPGHCCPAVDASECGFLQNSEWATLQQQRFGMRMWP